MNAVSATSDWFEFFNAEQSQPYFTKLINEVAKQRAAGEVIYPPENKVFSAFALTDLINIKVVILGQDPYHGFGQAHGLAFSVEHGVKTPPSLVNMYKELVTDIEGFTTPSHGNLLSWAEQGVLLLNTVLTVKEAQAHSHAKLGWEIFTDAVISQVNEQNPGCVFMLWGSHAQKKGKNINQEKHCVLAGPHPSPLSAYRGFFGCGHFSKANAWLKGQNKAEINWQLPEVETNEFELIP